MSEQKPSLWRVKHGTRETLVLVEGVEDCLSVALSWPGARIGGGAFFGSHHK